MVSMFGSGPGDRVLSRVESYQILKKLYLMPHCLTQHYKVRIKGKWSNPEKVYISPAHVNQIAGLMRSKTNSVLYPTY